MDHERLILQMMEITNCTESVALDYLTRTDYDVEIAVRHFFEGTMPEPIVNAPSPSVSSNSSSQASLPTPPDTPSASTPPPSRAVLPRYHFIVQFFAQLITFPVKFPLFMINLVYDYFFATRKINQTHIFEYIAKEYPEFEGAKANIFYGKSLQHLRSDLHRNNWKWLVAYIHDPAGSPVFFKSLFNSTFAEQIQSRGGVFFGCVMGSEDQKRLRPDRSYGRVRRSCVILFVIRGSSLTRKLMIDELSNPESVSSNIDLALLDLIADEADRQAQERIRNESRMLMEEQNREYQQSLQRDLERIAKGKAEKEAAEEALRVERQKQMESEMRVKKVQDYKAELKENDTVATGKHDLLIRFPSGKKIIKFDMEENIEKIFREAMKSDLCPLFFQMHENFPKRAVPCLPEWYFNILEAEELEPKEECLTKNLTFQDAGITHGSMVYVDNL